MRICLAALLLAGIAMPAAAQDASLDQRVTRVEKQLRAVQRKVFPGGSADYVEPEITPQAAPAMPAGIPATSAVTDLTARVDAIERQLAQMTGEAEQNGFQLRQLQDALTKLKGDTDYRLGALEGASGAAGTVVTAPGTGAVLPPGAPFAATRRSAPDTSTFAPPPPTVNAAAPAGDAGAPSSDAGEDAYMAGYRLWMAKKYPEAEAALRDAVAKYPQHKRASYSQNLLGRAYLDEGKPGLAAEAFYTNYKTNPRGERAPDSLYYLGQSLIMLKKPADACKVYDELNSVYGATLLPALGAKVAAARKTAKCS